MGADETKLGVSRESGGEENEPPEEFPLTSANIAG